MEFISSPEVQRIIHSYPRNVSTKLDELRQLILDTAKETDGLIKLLETTKWGEPSYLTKNGSTIRMDWKERNPEVYCLYFICSTELVSTFKFIFGDEMQFEGDRAIVLDLHAPLPRNTLKKCISLALNYKKLKHLPMLGA